MQPSSTICSDYNIRYLAPRCLQHNYYYFSCIITHLHCCGIPQRNSCNLYFDEIFTSFLMQISQRFQTIGIALLHVNNTTTQSINENSVFSTFFINMFNRFFDVFTASICDNCSNSQSIAKKIRNPLFI